MVFPEVMHLMIKENLYFFLPVTTIVRDIVLFAKLDVFCLLVGPLFGPEVFHEGKLPKVGLFFRHGYMVFDRE